MKNNYRKLKLSILLQTVFVTALTILVGWFILVYFLEDSSNEFVRMLTSSIHITEEAARHWYWKFLGNNKDIYVSLSKMDSYFRQVESGIDNIVVDSEESIEMITELKPIESKLTEIKSTLKKRELEAQEAEQRKNDLVVFLAHDLKTPLTSVVGYLTMLDSYNYKI